MSAGIAQPGPQLADMMQGIEQRIIMETLSTFFAYAAAHWKIEAFNYLPITFLLVIFAMTCKHPDPNVILGVNPQSCFEAVFGRIIRRSHPDWNFSLFPKDMGHKPFLGFIWEEKPLNIVPPMGGILMNMEGETVQTSVEKAMFADIKQLQEQALCAFFHYDGDVVYAFLNYRECIFLFEFRRPSNWAALKTEYQARFPKPRNGKRTRSAVKFDKKDLPRPLIHYYARSLRTPDGSALSPVFLKAFQVATSNLGLLENRFPLFQMPPEITEEDIVQPNLQEKLQEKLDKKIKERDTELIQEASSDDAGSDDSQDGDALESSSSHLSGPSKDTSRRRRARRREKKKKQAALSPPEDDNDVPSKAGIEDTTSSSPRGDHIGPSRDIAADSDSLVVEPLAGDAGAPKAPTHVQPARSDGISLADSDPVPVDEPPQVHTHKRERSDKSYVIPGSTDAEDEDVEHKPARPSTAYTAARAPNASNATNKSGHSATAHSQKRARPVTSALNRVEDDDGTVGRCDIAGTAGSSQYALPAEAGSGAETNPSMSQPRANACTAASRNKQREDGRGARSAAQSSLNQKRRHVGDSDAESNGSGPSVPSKKRKFPARGDALDSVVVGTDRSMPLAGPSNSRRLPSRGLATPRGGGARKRDKKKCRAA
ncbi:hypothetical protein EWM64_g1977 [Hericium alpestre]|uniref:Uncharacterized protein n=1 Tax=Hericium alpestre TaxID=135208 RepID=A0A4Z0A6S2_9AGAM|nr:hypothetical protein EWM64_g1977 [Hericium alpestre]